MKIMQPRITEKSISLSQKGWYSFAVTASMRKEDIAREIGRMFKVTVTDIHSIRRKGKSRRSGKKMIATKKPDWKIVLIRLAKGQKLPIFEQTAEGKTT